MGEVLRDRFCQFPRPGHCRCGSRLVRHTSIRGVVVLVQQMEGGVDESGGKEEE
jgi:hypothetical protein